MRTLELSGSHFEIGSQHGIQVLDLRMDILPAMERRLAALERLPGGGRTIAAELNEFWERINRPTLEEMRGIASALDFEWEDYFRYTTSSYLNDHFGKQAAGEGCTVWASLAEDGSPVLAKNRDYRPDHLALHCLARVRPDSGYAYLCVTSAGSPGVFSSGMNQAGLAVADTHVASLDTGPGLPRYSSMMAVLERCDRVDGALDYLKSVPHTGDGTLILLDEAGGMAVFEAGHNRQGVVRSRAGYVVSTNHFVTAGLRDQWLDQNPPDLLGQSLSRRAQVEAALYSAQGRVDLAMGKGLMGSHSSPRDSICRHPEFDPQSMTISTVFFYPRERSLLISSGLPCSSPYERYSF